MLKNKTINVFFPNCSENWHLVFVHVMSLCSPVSHINQKTQFENPVMEAKKKLSTDTPTGGPPPAATPTGNDNQPPWSRNTLLFREVLVTNELIFVDAN